MTDQKQSQFIEINELSDSDYLPAFGMSSNKKISKPNLFKQIRDETQIFIYPTTELLQAANLFADPDWPVYVRNEETEYRLYKITSIAPAVNDIALNNGTTATFQEEYSDIGFVVGPSPSIDGAIALFDGTSGTQLKNGAIPSTIGSAFISTPDSAIAGYPKKNTNNTLTIQSPGQLKVDLLLDQVNNTLDINKPISTDQQSALDLKVSGPSSALDSVIAIFSGTTGKIIKAGDTISNYLSAFLITLYNIFPRTLATFLTLSSTTAILGQIVNTVCHTSGTIGGGQFLAVPSSGLTPDGGTISVSATVGIYWQRVCDGNEVDITWFGVVPVFTGIPSDTTSIQQAVWDSPKFQAIFYPTGRYGVTKLTQKNPNMGLIYGDNAIMLGLATSPLNCMFELKQGNGFHMRGIKWGGRQNLNYVCGMHWYTNDLNTYYPGKATLDIEIGEFLLGVNVGMLATQSTYYAQGTVQADGIATDAPISECSVRIKIQDCPAGLRMCQPNGKLTLIDSYIEATAASWTTPTAQITWRTLMLDRFGEMAMIGGSLENITSTTGSLIEQNSGNLFIESVVIESSSKIRLSGNYFALRMSKLLNFGFNSTSQPMFVIKNDSCGTVDIDNSWLAFPYQNMTTGTASLAKGVSNTATESYAEAPNVLMTLSDVELRDCYGRSGAAWQMPCQGIKVKYDNVRHTSFQNVSNEVTPRLIDAKLSNSKNNVLAALVDSSASTITTYPVSTPTSTGGWGFGSGGGTYTYGSQAPTAGLNIESLNGVAQTPSKILRMQANSGVALTASSPSFGLEPFSYLFVTGWVYVGAGGASQAGVKCELRDFSDTLVTTVNIQLGAVNLLAAGWQPFTGWCQQVGNASKARVLLYVENGSDLQFHNVQAFIDN